MQGAFHAGGDNLGRLVVAGKKMDFWRRGKASPPKIHRGRGFV
jgi:hypothetical protein